MYYTMHLITGAWTGGRTRAQRVSNTAQVVFNDPAELFRDLFASSGPRGVCVYVYMCVCVVCVFVFVCIFVCACVCMCVCVRGSVCLLCVLCVQISIV